MILEQTGIEIDEVYTIDTELSTGNVQFLPEFLRRQYLLKHKKYRSFKNVELLTQNEGQSLSYRVVVPEKGQYVDVRVHAQNPIRVTMKPSDPSVPKTFLNQLNEDLFLMVQVFEEEIRKTTLYFAFMPGEKAVPEREKTGWIPRIFTDSMLTLYIVFMAVTFLFFWLFSLYTPSLLVYVPLFFVGLSFLFSLLSGKLVARSGNWRITKDNPEIHLLQYHFSPSDYEKFRKTHARQIPEIRKRLHDATIAQGKPIDCKTAGEVFSNYGIECKQTDFSVKTVNLFEIVKKASRRFRIAMPTIVVINSIIPNAAAAGPNSGLGTILVTTGIMTQLEEDELLTIIGHELSHLKAHDPLVMFALSSGEYLLRIYVFWEHIFYFGFISYWIYFMMAMSLIYLFGKFIEGRADLDAAKIIGPPDVLAEALRK
ncbi:MAG: M48 family metallopeptidase, partial [Candidatus Hodarchaeota archaeon]